MYHIRKSECANPVTQHEEISILCLILRPFQIISTLYEFDKICAVYIFTNDE